MTELSSIVARAREIARTVVARDAAEVDEQARWPEAGLRALQREGLGGLVVPARSGGLGLGLLALAQVCEELGRECASTGISFGMHCVGSAVISAKATPHQRGRYLETISAGRHLTSLALSEPGSGAHFYYPETRLVVESPNTYRVSGKKVFATNGGHADSYVVSTVASEPDAPPGHFSCVLVAAEAEGLVWGPAWEGLGMRGNSSRALELRDVPVPRQDLLGEEGDQIWYVFEVVAPYFLMAMAGTYLGVAGAAVEEATAHLSRRTYAHSGGKLSHHQVVQHRLGSLWAQVQRTRRLIYWAAAEADERGALALPALCSAKAEVADCVVQVVNEAMTLCGGSVYRDGSRLERLLRDGRAAHVMAPTTDILRVWAGRALLGLPLLGD
ncbi:MAG TPA: acyl-CoA dehydrogenase family protein [Kofleriaceae bacterium]|nr:acyl-CoA dehydrogenase family protein [Kofleriaceae bacterium]